MEQATAAETSAFDAFMADTAGIPEMADARTNWVSTADVPDTPPGVVSVQWNITPEMVGNILAMPFEVIAGNIGKDGEFWRLSELEKQSLGSAWLPVVNKLLDMIGLSNQGPLALALLLTAMSLTPRLAKERTRRELAKATTGTERSTVSQVSSDPPPPANHGKPTEWSGTAEDVFASFQQA